MEAQTKDKKIKNYLALFNGVAVNSSFLKAFKGYIRISSVKYKDRMIVLLECLYELKKKVKDITTLEVDIKVFSKVFPKGLENKNMYMTEFRKLTSSFYTLLTEYLALGEIRKSKNLRRRLFSDAVKDYKLLDETFILENNRLIKDLSKVKNSRDLALLERTHEELYFHPNARLHANIERRLNLMTSIEYLDSYYKIQALKKGCELIVQSVIYKEKYQKEKVHPWLKNILENTPFTKEHPLEQIFELSTLFFLDPDKQKYDDLKSKFEGNHQLYHDERWTIIRFMIVGVSIINLAPKEKMQEYFEHYKFAIDKELLVSGEYLSFDNFNNIVFTAFQLEEYDYAKHFIADHTQYLEDNGVNKSIQFLLSECYRLFSKEKKYQEVVDILGTLKHEDFSYVIRKHVLILKCIYESHESLKKNYSKVVLQDYDYEINSHSRTVTAYLKRELEKPNVSEELIRKNLNFVKMVKAIYKVRNGKFSKEQVKAKMDGFGNELIENLWLTKKIELLKK